MHRRTFARTTLAGIGGLVVGTPRWVRQAQPVTCNGPRLLKRLRTLATFGRNDRGGISRVAYSDADLAARHWARQRMTDAGLDVHIDLAGNLVGRRIGTDDTLPPLTLGSHIDSVPEGGNFDGQVGSMGAIEVAHTLHERGIPTRHPLEVLIFQNEEGGKTGSRALIGEVEPAELDIVTASGYTIRDGIARLGGDPTRLADAVRLPPSGGPPTIAGFLELHIEQGAVLDTDGIDIGVVEGIVGIKRWNVTVTGMANHAGTTPMDRRHDALLSAGRFIDAVNRVVREHTGSQVATVGRIDAEPGAPNVIPGRVRMSLEIRDLSMDTVDAVFDDIRVAAVAIGASTGTRYAFERFYVSHEAPTAEAFRRAIEAAADRLRLSHRRMPSGAGHDAQSMARLGPVGMVFVPSVLGISHAAAEFTKPGNVVNGANVLLNALVAIDRT